MKRTTRERDLEKWMCENWGARGIGKWNGNLVIFVKTKINKIIPYPNPNYLKYKPDPIIYNTIWFYHHIDKAYPYCKWIKWMDIPVWIPICEYDADTA